MNGEFLKVLFAVIGIGYDHVVADAGTDKDLADTGQFAQLLEKLGVGLVIDAQERADLWVDATFVLASTAGGFDPTFKAVHVGGGSG